MTDCLSIYSDLNSKNNSMNFQEKLNVENAKYLLNLPNDYLKSEMYDPEEQNENGNKWDVDIYLKSLKKFLKLVIFKEGNIKREYKFSNNLKNKGRLYVKGFGIQSLQFRLRGFLINEFYNDFDMINAHPTILLHICNKYFSNVNFPMLNKYVLQRDEMLNKYKTNKKDILISMNTDKITCKTNKLIQGLDKEFKTIQNMLWNLEEFEELKDETKRNKKGSFLNIICCIFENNILQKAISKVGCSVPMFDGFLLDKKFDVNDTLFQLYELSSEFGILWKVKPHNIDIVKQDWVMEEEILVDYETSMINFNENHFLVKNPLTFCFENDKASLSMYNRADFSALVEPVQYQIISKNGDVENRNLFKCWMKDKQRREYDRIDFVPTFKEINSKIYNTFKGFQFTGENNSNSEAVERFMTHLKLLVNFEEKSFIYLKNYIAHLFQKTDVLPGIALLFKSQQGVGKDLMIDFIQKILGNDLVYRTAKLNDIFEKFNGCLKNKVILQLNEIQGGDGFARKEDLKNLMTQKDHNINEKNLKQYSLTNYLRIIIFSNNLIPVEIPYDDRRYCVFKCGRKQPRQYYNDLLKDLNDDSALNSILTYFKNIDISAFDLNKRPETSAYKDMKDASINPFYKFLFDNYNEMNDEDIECLQEEEGFIFRKKTNEIIVTPSNLMNSYRYYLEMSKMTHIKLAPKTMNMMMADMGFETKSVKIKGRVIKPYKIRIEHLREELKQRGIEEVDEVIEDLDL